MGNFRINNRRTLKINNGFFKAGPLVMAPTTTTTTTSWTPTVQCSGSNPSIGLTITGTTGSITWCGQTWNLPTDSGVTKEVCPTSYLNVRRMPSIYHTGINSWKYSYNGTFRLARAAIEYYMGTLMTHLNIIDGFFDSRVSSHVEYPYAQTGTTHTSRAGLISNVPFPTVQDYQITDEFFGSYTISNITYSWQRGTNW